MRLRTPTPPNADTYGTGAAEALYARATERKVAITGGACAALPFNILLCISRSVKLVRLTVVERQCPQTLLWSNALRDVYCMLKHAHKCSACHKLADVALAASA